MIEYTLVSSILDKICEMIKNPLEYPKNDTQLVPSRAFARNQNMGNKMEEAN
jgi:hypothetical protein